MLFDQQYYLQINEARWSVASRIIKMLADVETCLDVGCGPGWFSKRLSDLGLLVTGLDGRATLIEEAQRRAPSANFRVADITSRSDALQILPSDFSLCFGLLYHLEDPLRAIRNLGHLTTKYSLIETVIAPQQDASLVMVSEGVNETQGLTYHAIILSRKALLKMLYMSGFRFVYRYVGSVNHLDFIDTPDRIHRREIFLASKNAPLSLADFVYEYAPETSKIDYSRLSVMSNAPIIENAGADVGLRQLHGACNTLRKCSPDVLPSFAAFLYKIRSKMHPIGRHDYRSIKFGETLHFVVDLGDRLGCDFYYGNYAEFGDTVLFNRMVHESSVILDIGANFGLYSIYTAAQPGFSGKVYAFEPNDTIRQVLETNVANNFLTDQVVIDSTALADKEGQRVFYSAEESSFSGLADTHRSNIVSAETVNISTVDLYVSKNGLNKVDLIKIDVEGGEALVLAGSIETIYQNPDICILIEASAKNFGEDGAEHLIRQLQVLLQAGFVGWYFDTSFKQFTVSQSFGPEILKTFAGNIFLVKHGGITESRLIQAAEDILKAGSPPRLQVSRPTSDEELAYGDAHVLGQVAQGVKLASEPAVRSHAGVEKLRTKSDRPIWRSASPIIRAGVRPVKKLLELIRRKDVVADFVKNGRVPWSLGYKQYRYNLLQSIPTDRALLETFARNAPLPRSYGMGIDERIVEYPWLLSRITGGGGLVLDGGSALNYPFLLDGPQLSDKRLTILTLAPESTMAKRQNVSYMFGDLRETLFRDAIFDLIVSISTLEHVGMDNAKLYTHDDHHQESRPEDYLKVIEEFRRVLRPGGRFLMTVPYGKPQNLGWLHQFDSQRLKQTIHAFGSGLEAITFFKYGPEGWMLADENACADSEYFDVHSAAAPAADLAAAARAVACLEFVKHA